MGRGGAELGAGRANGLGGPPRARTCAPATVMVMVMAAMVMVMVMAAMVMVMSTVHEYTLMNRR